MAKNVTVNVKTEVQSTAEIPAPSYWRRAVQSDIIHDVVCVIDHEFAIEACFYGPLKPGTIPSYCSANMRHKPDLQKLVNGEYVQCTKSEFDEIWKAHATTVGKYLTHAANG